MGDVVDLESFRKLKDAKVVPYEPDIMKAILTTDDIGAVIRTHIFIEFHLDKRLTGYLEDGGKRSFFDKVKLARSKALITKADASALHALNQLRNDFAHELDFELTPERLDRFLRNLRGFIRELYDEVLPEIDIPISSPGREQRLLRAALGSI